LLAGERLVIGSAAARVAEHVPGPVRAENLLFLTFLANTIVSVALGSVQAGLHAGVSALQ
jgi:hypothetical protein